LFTRPETPGGTVGATRPVTGDERSYLFFEVFFVVFFLAAFFLAMALNHLLSGFTNLRVSKNGVNAFFWWGMLFLR
jgi:hypothetical protein